MQSLYICHKEASALFFNRNGGSGGVEWLLGGTSTRSAGTL